MTIERQMLDRRNRCVEDVVEHLCGLNAQTPRGPSAGLFSRIEGFRQDDLDGLLKSYNLVKANLMRGTVHMVTARQFFMWRRFLQPVLMRTVSGFCRGLLSRVEADRLIREGTALLAGSPGLTRSEIGAELTAVFPHEEARDLGFAVRMLAPVVQEADETVWSPARTRYVLAQHVMPGEFADEGAGGRDLVASYLRAFGPSTPGDASYFTGRTGLKDVLGQVAANRSDLRRQEFDVEHDVFEPRPAFVLPEYDNVFFARKAGALQDARRRLIPNPATLMHGSLFRGREVVGSWVKGDDGLPVLTAWREIDPESVSAFNEFREWYGANGEGKRK